MALKKVFTEEGVRKLSPPRAGRNEIGDAIVRGLVLRVTKNGLKTWSVIYKVPGQGSVSARTGNRLKGTQKRITLGPYPIVGVAQARTEATELAACATKMEAQREVSQSDPLEVREVAGELDGLRECLLRSGAAVNITGEGGQLFVVPHSVAAETKLTQIVKGRIQLEHRAYGRTLTGKPLGWEYLDLVDECL